MHHSATRQFDQPSQRQRIPLMVQRRPVAPKPRRTTADQLRFLAMSALAVGVMSLVGLSSAESRPVTSGDTAAEVQMGPQAKRCVEMAMGRSVRRFAFEAAVRQDRLDPFHDERLARDLDHAKSRCHAAFETAHGSYSQFATGDREG